MHFASLYRWLAATEHWGLPLSFDQPVLDIGADDGRFLLQVSAPLKVGTDLLARPHEMPFPWVGADGRRLPFADCSFGHVFAFDVIEHVVEDAHLFREAVRVLQPGGTLWLSTPAHRFYMFPGGYVQRRFERSIGHVRRGYSRAMLAERLPEGCRLEIVWWNEPAFRYGYIFLYALKRLSPGLPNRLIPDLMRFDAGHTQGEAGHLFARIRKQHGA
jgi:SAM-dependent methyltransferase